MPSPLGCLGAPVAGGVSPLLLFAAVRPLGLGEPALVSPWLGQHLSVLGAGGSGTACGRTAGAHPSDPHAGPSLPPTDEDVGSCPNSQVFLYNLTTCQQTCRSLSEADTHCVQGFAPVDGCGCPVHTFLDEKGRCVSLAKCSCYYHGLYLEAGEVVLRQEERWWVAWGWWEGWEGVLYLGGPTSPLRPLPL